MTNERKSSVVFSDGAKDGAGRELTSQRLRYRLVCLSYLWPSGDAGLFVPELLIVMTEGNNVENSEQQATFNFVV